MMLDKLSLYIAEKLPNRKCMLSAFLQDHFQVKLNKMLANSMENFNYLGFKFSLYCGADPNIDAQIETGYHLVTRCARSGEEKFLRTLLKFDGDVSGGGKRHEFSPLHMAASKGMVATIAVLVEFGADIHALFYPQWQGSHHGWTPIICACKQKKLKVVNLLLSLGANPQDADENGCDVGDFLGRAGWFY